MRSLFATCFMLACGSSAPAQTVALPPAAPSTATPDDLGTRTEVERTRARQLVAGALELRQHNLGACPTLNDVTQKYEYPPGTELDTSGAPFAIECTDADVRIVSHDHRVIHIQAYAAAVVERGSESPSTVSTTASIPITGTDAAIARLRSQFRACYNAALASDPTTSGVVHGTMVVARDGSTKSMVFDKKTTTITNVALLACLKGKLMLLHSDPRAAEEQVSF